MARPTKQGIDYFPIDCQFDDKIEIYITEKEAPGLAVLVTIWQMIYHNEGYYITNNKDLHLLVKRRINVDINEVNDCINLCLTRNIFDLKLHKKYQILTSKAIQKRYFEAAQRKKTVLYDVKYIINGINVCINAVNVVHQSLYVKEDVKEDVNVKEDSLSPLQALWNEICGTKLNKVVANSKSRKVKEKLRLVDREYNLWDDIFVKILQSEFCCGKNDRGWRASYDWIMSNDTNAIKVIEGKYDERKGDGNGKNNSFSKRKPIEKAKRKSEQQPERKGILSKITIED